MIDWKKGKNIWKNVKNIEVKVEDLKKLLSKKNSKIVEVGGIFAQKKGAKKPQKKKYIKKSLNKSPQKPKALEAQNRGRHRGSRPYINYKAPRPCRLPMGRENNIVWGVNVPATGYKRKPCCVKCWACGKIGHIARFCRNHCIRNIPYSTNKKKYKINLLLKKLHFPFSHFFFLLWKII